MNSQKFLEKIQSNHFLLLFAGMIWALQTSGEIFCFSPENRKPNMVQSPDHVVFEYIGATSDSVWALSSNWDVYVRMYISERCPGGTLWKKLNLNQFGECTLFC